MPDLSTLQQQDNYSTRLASKYTAGGSSFTVQVAPSFSYSVDFYATVQPGTTKARAYKISGISGTTLTISGSAPVATYEGETPTAIDHPAGSKVIISNNFKVYDDIRDAINSKVSTDEDQTISKRTSWSGTNAAPNVPSFANTTARDAAITAPSDGDLCTVAGDLQHYNGTTTQWETADTGTPTPNAADNTAGKVDVASAAEIGAGTATDASSGAINVIPVSQTVKTSSGSGDENKLPVLDSNGKLAAGFVDLSTTVLKSTYSAKGDILAASAASTPAAVSVGANGTVLTADSGETSGVKWGTVPGAIANVYTPVTVSNTVTQTNLFSVSIPANTLGTNGAIKGKVALSSVGFNSSATLTLRLTFGGTNILTHTISFPAAVSEDMNGFYEFTILASGATDSQVFFGQLDISDNYAQETGGAVGHDAVFNAATGSATKDSTTSQTLTLSAQWGGASSNSTITMYSAILEKLPL